jgi:hypothetical protein
MPNDRSTEEARATLEAMREDTLQTLLEWLTQPPIVHGYPDSVAMAEMVRSVQQARRAVK